MRKLAIIILFLFGIAAIGYVSIEYLSIKTGQSNALHAAEEIVDEKIIKQGGGTKPIPLLNGQAAFTTINGEETFTTEQLQEHLLNRDDVTDYINAAQEVSPQPSYEQMITNIQTNTNQPYTMSNILDYYEQAANNVNFNQLQTQQYGVYSIGQAIGVLYIPALNRSLPIIYGTEENELKYGVGFHKNTKMPGQQDQILLAGHRDTVFRDFGQLKIGDEFHVKTAKGTYIYTIFATQIVKWDDPTVIQSTYPYEVLTVSTCYPFTYLGPSPERYILYAY